jgi:vitamin B12/bleomycin/antimicrobial peptide transport system ATP-binding/permease protein
LAYDDFAGYRAVLNRLTGLLDANDEVGGLPTSVTELRQAGLGIRNLEVKLPDGRPLLTDLDIEMAGGASFAGQGLLGQRQDPRCCGAWHGCGRKSRAPSRAPRTGIPCSPRNSRNCRWPLGTLRTALAYAPTESLGE